MYPAEDFTQSFNNTSWYQTVFNLYISLAKISRQQMSSTCTFLFFPEKRDWHFILSFSNRNDLNKMSSAIFSFENYFKCLNSVN